MPPMLHRVPKNAGVFSTVPVRYNRDFKTFCIDYTDGGLSCGGAAQLSEMKNIFNVSCIPWISFTGFNLNLQKGYRYLLTIFTVGKYSRERRKVLCPQALQIHQAACDGCHAPEFICKLQEWADSSQIRSGL